MDRNSERLKLIGLLFALLTSGFSFMILEIIFLRELLITLGGAVYASSAMLASVMCGLFFGSQIFGYLTTKIKNTAALLAAMEFSLALCSCVLIPGIRFLGRIESWPWRYSLSFLIILIPSALVGGEIPVSMQYAERHIEKGRVGFYAGLIYGADTLGALIGAIVLPFGLLPRLGAYQSSLIAALGDFSSGLIIAFWITKHRQDFILAAGLIFMAAAVGLKLQGHALDARSASWSLRYRYKYLKKPNLVSYFFKDSAYQRIHIADVNFEPAGKTNSKIRVLLLDALAQSSNSPSRTYREIIYFPLLAHPNPKKILFIGCGDGDLVASALADPRVEHIDHVDIDPVVTSIAEREIPEINHHKGQSIWNNPKVTLLNMDGRQFIRSTNDLYDLIFSDLLDAMQEGSSIFYSIEFMRLIRARLNDRGIFATHDYIAPEVASNWRLQISSLLIAARTTSEVFGNNIYLMSPKLWPRKTKESDAADTTFLFASKGPLQVTKKNLDERLSHLDPKPLWFTRDRFWRWMENSYLPEGFEKLPLSTDDKPLILYPHAFTKSEAVNYIAREYY
ncbi:MAG: fused MFS/spermidine synthase [Elusimicrobia bacterium]|nr:fused MFS/spermidine synthase [Elusimicrobiota bacterium]